MSEYTMIDKKTMKYNVLIEDVNHNIFVEYNIFEHNGFVPDLVSEIKECGDNRYILDERLESILRFYFWRKCEYEIVISSLIFTDRTKPIKTDAYEQIMLNWAIFEEYIWNNREKILNEYAENDIKNN